MAGSTHFSKMVQLFLGHFLVLFVALGHVIDLVFEVAASARLAFFDWHGGEVARANGHRAVLGVTEIFLFVNVLGHVNVTGRHVCVVTDDLRTAEGHLVDWQMRVLT